MNYWTLCIKVGMAIILNKYNFNQIQPSIVFSRTTNIDKKFFFLRKQDSKLNKIDLIKAGSGRKWMNQS